jgi:protein subunit release factor A
LTHIPTGLVAQCQDQKSQHKIKTRHSAFYVPVIMNKLAKKTSWRCYKTYVPG